MAKFEVGFWGWVRLNARTPVEYPLLGEFQYLIRPFFTENWFYIADFVGKASLEWKKGNGMNEMWLRSDLLPNCFKISLSHNVEILRLKFRSFLECYWGPVFQTDIITAFILLMAIIFRFGIINIGYSFEKRTSFSLSFFTSRRLQLTKMMTWKNDSRTKQIFYSFIYNLFSKRIIIPPPCNVYSTLICNKNPTKSFKCFNTIHSIEKVVLKAVELFYSTANLLLEPRKIQ